MQTSLERRLAALEQASPPSRDMIILVRFDEPGQPDVEVRALTAGAARWERRPDEDEVAFVNRAVRDAPPTAAGLVLVSD